MWHVLEHFHDPHRYIADIIRLLKPGGICLVALPNSGSCDAKYYRQVWAALDVPRHLWHFDPVTFTDFVRKSGLKVERQLVLPFDVFYISVLSEKYKGSRWPFIEGITRAIWFSLSFSFRQDEEQFGHLCSEETVRSITINPAIFSGIIPQLNSKSQFMGSISHPLDPLKCKIKGISDIHILIFHPYICNYGTACPVG